MKNNTKYEIIYILKISVANNPEYQSTLIAKNLQSNKHKHV